MTKLQLSSFATAVVLAVGVGTAAHAAERATPREARTMFEQAVRYMEENGPERAFAAFNDRQGGFVRKDLYVFAIDDKGVYQASGAAPEALVGLIAKEGYASLVKESLIIGGWVALWRPMEIFLYDWWPIDAQARLYDRLGAIQVGLRAADARQVQVA